MKLAPQKLYKINEYFWLLYPTKETAGAAEAAATTPAASAAGAGLPT